MVEQNWLDVPYAGKDRAKKAGARWDPAAKRWFAPRKGMTELQEWAAASDVPDLLPGEDRTLGSGLFVGLPVHHSQPNLGARALVDSGTFVHGSPEDIAADDRCADGPQGRTVPGPAPAGRVSP